MSSSQKRYERCANLLEDRQVADMRIEMPEWGNLVHLCTIV